MAAEFLPGNRLTLLNSGSDYFPALLAAIGGAQTEIYLESYIFADDEIGHEVASALCQAAERGVLVNVTVDGFGARNFAADFLPMLTSAGVRAMYYRPEIGRFHLKRHRLRRLHRKLVVIDARIAFVGGGIMLTRDQPCQRGKEAEGDPGEGDAEQHQQHILQGQDVRPEGRPHLPGAERRHQRGTTKGDQPGQHHLRRRSLKGGAGRRRGTEVLHRHVQRRLGRGRGGQTVCLRRARLLRLRVRVVFCCQ